MDGFGKRLRELRGSKTQAEVAEAMGLKVSSYAMYEIDKREPSFQTLCVIAEYHKVSIDYLLGRTDCQTQDVDIKYLVEKTGLSETAIYNLCTMKQEFPDLIDTAVSLVSSFDNLVWITSSIRETIVHKCALAGLELWFNQKQEKAEYETFYLENHITLVRKKNHTLFDCIEAFRNVVDNMIDHAAETTVASNLPEQFESMYQKWESGNGKA